MSTTNDFGYDYVFELAMQYEVKSFSTIVQYEVAVGNHSRFDDIWNRILRSSKIKEPDAQRQRSFRVTRQTTFSVALPGSSGEYTFASGSLGM